MPTDSLVSIGGSAVLDLINDLLYRILSNHTTLITQPFSRLIANTTLLSKQLDFLFESDIYQQICQNYTA